MVFLWEIHDTNRIKVACTCVHILCDYHSGGTEMQLKWPRPVETNLSLFNVHTHPLALLKLHDRNCSVKMSYYSLFDKREFCYELSSACTLFVQKRVCINIHRPNFSCGNQGSHKQFDTILITKVDNISSQPFPQSIPHTHTKTYINTHILSSADSAHIPVR